MFIASMFGRATTGAEAVVLLCEEGFGREAMFVGRAVHELMIDAWWASADLNRAEEMIVKHARWDRERRLDLADEHELPGSPSGAERLEADERRTLDKLFRSAGGSWTGRSLKARVDDLESHLGPERTSEFRKLTAVFAAANNSEMHPGPLSLARGIRSVPYDDTRRMLQFFCEKEPALCDSAVANTWWAYVNLLDLVGDLFGPLPGSVGDLVDEGGVAFGGPGPTPEA